jgi:hypothetical protein
MSRAIAEIRQMFSFANDAFLQLTNSAINNHSQPAGASRVKGATSGMRATWAAMGRSRKIAAQGIDML